MLVAIPSNVFVRNYGPYTYVFDQSGWREVLIRDIGPMISLLSRSIVDVDVAVRVVAEKLGLSVAQIRNDAMDLISVLADNGYLLHGNSVELIANRANLRYKEHARAEAVANGVQESGERDSELSVTRTEPAKDQLFEYFRLHQTPFELCIDLTRACTERCVHCYVPNFQNVFLPFETIEKVLSEFAAMGGLKVKLTGGECMLHPDFERILEVARAHDLVISVLSNLTCCDESKVRAMKDVAVAVVQVSLYGMTPETHEAVTQVKGSLEKTLRGIRLLREVGVPVQIHCPVLKQNASGIEAVKRFGREMGMKTTFDAVMMSRADHICNADCSLPDESLLQFIVAHEDLPSEIEPCPEATEADHVCEIGTAKLCLSAEGKYYPCNGCYGLVLGDCRRQTLEEVWNAEPIKRLRQLRMRDLSKCRTCPNRMFCAPCPSRNFNANGDVTVPDASMCRAAACRREVVEDKRRGS